jgi:hypothetical protein
MSAKHELSALKLWESSDLPSNQSLLQFLSSLDGENQNLAWEMEWATMERERESEILFEFWLI